jgi:hypothetical protein
MKKYAIFGASGCGRGVLPLLRERGGVTGARSLLMEYLPLYTPE